MNPVKREGKPDLADIELWPRCVPEGMVFKVMDVTMMQTILQHSTHDGGVRSSSDN